MVRNTSFSRKFRVELDEISKKHGIEYDELEEMLDLFFRDLKKFMTDPRMPTIKIINFGTFKPTLGKINFLIRKLFWLYKKKGRTKNRVTQAIKKSWAVRRRLQQEQQYIETWKCWSKYETLEECYENCVRAKTKE